MLTCHGKDDMIVTCDATGCRSALSVGTWKAWEDSGIPQYFGSDQLRRAGWIRITWPGTDLHVCPRCADKTVRECFK